MLVKLQKHFEYPARWFCRSQKKLENTYFGGEMLGMASRDLGSFLSLPHSWAASVDSDLTIGIVGTGWRTHVSLPRKSPPLSPELRSACGRGPSDRSAGFWREALRRPRTASRAPASSSRTTSPSSCSRLFPNTVVSTLKFVHCYNK